MSALEITGYVLGAHVLAVLVYLAVDVCCDWRTRKARERFEEWEREIARQRKYAAARARVEEWRAQKAERTPSVSDIPPPPRVPSEFASPPSEITLHELSMPFADTPDSSDSDTSDSDYSGGGGDFGGGGSSGEW